jgi:hypothetical protein
MEWIWEPGSRAPLRNRGRDLGGSSRKSGQLRMQSLFYQIFFPPSPGRDREDGIVRLAETRVPLSKKRETGMRKGGEISARHM